MILGEEQSSCSSPEKSNPFLLGPEISSLPDKMGINYNILNYKIKIN